MFKIVFKRLINWLLPVRLRKINQKAWLKALNKPLISLYGSFHKFRNENLYFLSIGNHVADLERMLNDKFDDAFRRIRIADAPLSFDQLDVYRVDESNPVFLFRDSENQPKPLFTDDESLFGGYDFVVEVPVSLVYDTSHMIATINKFKTPGKGFIIQEI